MPNFFDFPLVVAGSGFFGATIAHRAANELGIPVLVLERRNHVGGNCYSAVDSKTGIEYHKYGSHIFHTSSEFVWKFITKFSEFNNYRHRVFSRFRGRTFTMPINLMTINQFYDCDFSPKEAQSFIADQIASAAVKNPRNLEEKAISQIGRPLYEAFMKGYTIKQWGTDPKKLPAEIINRLPVRFSFNDFYFSDAFEGLPLEGYTAIFNNMLQHEKILILTGCDYFDVCSQLHPNTVKVYTGPIDRYFDYRFGVLGWRTLDFEIERLNVGDYQGAAIMNYPELDVEFTRTHEFKHLYPERQIKDSQTLIMREYSRSAGKMDEPYYPIRTSDNKSCYEKYRDLAAQERFTIFGGRLGTYRYLDMHQAIGAALMCFDSQVVPLLQDTQFGSYTSRPSNEQA